MIGVAGKAEDIFQDSLALFGEPSCDTDRDISYGELQLSVSPKVQFVGVFLVSHTQLTSRNARFVTLIVQSCASTFKANGRCDHHLDLLYDETTARLHFECISRPTSYWRITFSLQHCFWLNGSREASYLFRAKQVDGLFFLVPVNLADIPSGVIFSS
jgi:hypothetical protein